MKLVFFRIRSAWRAAKCLGLLATGWVLAHGWRSEFVSPARMASEMSESRPTAPTGLAKDPALTPALSPRVRVRQIREIAAQDESRPASSGVTQRILVWVVVTALLPLASLAARRAILTEGGNGLMLLLLIGFTAASAWVARAHVSDGLDPFWGGLLQLFLLPVAAVYHFKALEFLREQFG